MKRRIKKLHLHRDTVALLGTQLARVVGGADLVTMTIATEKTGGTACDGPGPK